MLLKSIWFYSKVPLKVWTSFCLDYFYTKRIIFDCMITPFKFTLVFLQSYYKFKSCWPTQDQRLQIKLIQYRNLSAENEYISCQQSPIFKLYLLLSSIFAMETLTILEWFLNAFSYRTLPVLLQILLSQTQTCFLFLPKTLDFIHLLIIFIFSFLFISHLNL